MHFKTREQARQYTLGFTGFVRECLQVVKTTYWDMTLNRKMPCWTVVFNTNTRVICTNTLMSKMEK